MIAVLKKIELREEESSKEKGRSSSSGSLENATRGLCKLDGICHEGNPEKRKVAVGVAFIIATTELC